MIFVENHWKILEPVSNLQFPVSQIDLVLIPLLCFDKKGYRVGYGKGYYDRFLADCRPDVLKIGLSIFEPIEQIKDVDAYDIRLDFCITPNKIWQFS
jgi:5-formyltetrahydrofolate cyclo-ligase